MWKAVACFLLITSTAGYAQSRDPAIVSVTGFIDAYSAWNRNHPADDRNFPPGIGSTASRSTLLNLNLVVVDVQRQPRRWGFHLVAGAGPAMDVLHSGETTDGHLQRDFRQFVYQASLLYAPSERMELEAGIYPSHIGFESFLSKDDWTYTRGWLAEFSPYYQTGVKGTFRVAGHLTAQLHVVRGWQLIVDNNHALSFGTQVAWTGDRLSAALNTHAGPELPDDTRHQRALIDLVVTGLVTPQTKIAASIDVGEQQALSGSPSRWWGMGVQARREVTPRLAVATRIERFVDRRGVVAGDIGAVTGITSTVEVRRAVLWKFEARYDVASSPIFHRGEQFARNQLLFVAGGVFTIPRSHL